MGWSSACFNYSTWLALSSIRFVADRSLCRASPVGGRCAFAERFPSFDDAKDRRSNLLMVLLIKLSAYMYIRIFVIDFFLAAVFIIGNQENIVYCCYYGN